MTTESVTERNIEPTEDAQQLMADYMYFKAKTECESEALRLLELATCRLLRTPASPHYQSH